MREIKFRAWDKISKKIHYFTIAEAIFNTYEKTPFGLTNIELMQFTGLHDKNGKEIYEGDIVKIKLVRNNAERIGDVCWAQAHTHFYINITKATDCETGVHSVGYSGSGVKGIYVIGNVAQNPELLESEVSNDTTSTQ